MWERVKGVNIELLNYVLSHARYAVYLRQNLARFEAKRVRVWDIFVGMLKKDVGLMFKYGHGDFEKVFLKDCRGGGLGV